MSAQGARTAADARSHPAVSAGAAAAPVVQAAAYSPCPGRRLWIYAARCPSGHGTHLHRGGPPRPDGHLRTAPCGVTYRIVVPALVPGQRDGGVA